MPLAPDAEVLVLRAERAPLPGVPQPGPHQTYRHPRLLVEKRELGRLAPGQVRVEMLYAGLCGTDLHVAQCDPRTGYVLGSAPFSLDPEGRVLGHEGVGRIVAVGDGVHYLGPGRLVTFESIIRCYQCDPCRRGDFNQCERAVLLGMERDGLFGSVVDVPALLAHDVSDLEDLEGGLRAAACVEPAACGYVAASLCRVTPGDRVLVFGAGPIGLFSAMLCRLAFGAVAVHVVEPVPFRRGLAARWADRAWGVEEFFAQPPPLRFDVLIEASGALENVDRAFRLLGPNGRVALLARSGRPLSLGGVDHMITNNISILGSRGHLCGAFSDVLSLFRAGRIPLHDAVTEVVDGLHGLRESLADPAAVIGRNCKVLARIGGGALD
jgi:threonine dehydrogenase-like Zn-dependent dehydrogenase